MTDTGSPRIFARVAIPVPLGQAFSYVVPPNLAAGVRRGARVLCPFGRRRVLGVVLELGHEAPDIPEDKLKPLQAVVDPEPVLQDELLGFLQELARYYIAPIGEVIELALPAVERTAAEALSARESFAVESLGRMVQQVTAVAGAEAAAKLGEQAREIFEHLRSAGPETTPQLSKRWPNARAAVKRLEALNLVITERIQAHQDPFFAQVARDVPPELTAPQAAAVERLTSSLAEREKRGFLLDGVTASAKPRCICGPWSAPSSSVAARSCWCPRLRSRRSS